WNQLYDDHAARAATAGITAIQSTGMAIRAASCHRAFGAPPVGLARLEFLSGPSRVNPRWAATKRCSAIAAGVTSTTTAGGRTKTAKAAPPAPIQIMRHTPPRHPASMKAATANSVKVAAGPSLWMPRD